MMDISSLNRWQRMRIVALALGCGAKSELLLNQNQQNKPFQESCPSCGSKVFNQAAIPFTSPARSLVDKHFDALAQTMSELNIEWGVRSSVAGASKDLTLEFHRHVDDADVAKQNNDGLCFLCSLARRVNNSTEENNDESQNENKQENNASWWWKDKFSPDYVHMETGDIGPFDPVEEYIEAPVRSWTENVRYFLSSTTARLSKLVLKPVQSFDEETGEVHVTEPGDREQDQSEKLEALSKKLSFVDAMLVVNVSASSSISLSETSIPENYHGFNRSRIVLCDNLKKSFSSEIMKSPLSYSNFLFDTISQITSCIVAKNIVASSADDLSNYIVAALTASVFSDARRRQISNNDQQQHQFGGGGGMIPGLPVNVVGAAPVSTAPSPQQQAADNTLAMIMASRKAASTAAPKQEDQEGEANNNVDDLLAKIEQKKQIMMMTQQSTGTSQQQPAPAPPFLLPLSYYEEMLVLSSAAGSPTASFHEEWNTLREYVELADHEEEELTNPMFQRPSYVLELGKYLKKAM